MVRSNGTIVSGVALAMMLFLCGMGLVPVALAQHFQKVPILLRASESLPRGVLSGPNYTVKETVRNDGLINIYEIESQYDLLKVESTALLLKRVAELRALSKIDELKGTDVYKTSRKPQAFKPGDEWCPERSQVKPGEAEQISI